MANLSTDRLREMLDATYELEGLIQLSLNREPIPERILTLIETKLADLNAFVSEELQDESSDRSDLSERSDRSDLSERSDLSDPSDPSDPIATPANENYELEEDQPELVVEEQPVSPVPVVEEQPVSPVSVVEEQPVSPVSVGESRIGGAPVFSINDRFLYSRELFGGRVADFERALKEIASMENYEEAEDYFVNEWGFDPDQPVAAEFMAVIAKYF